MSLENEATKEDIWSIMEDITATFSPPIHPDHFNHYTTEQPKEFTRSIEDMNRVIRCVCDHKESLVLIDAIQRLGLDHYFREQIKNILESNYLGFDSKNYQTLKEASLLFRLLRQGGYCVSTGLFCNFLDANGMFEKILAKDTNGLMELYEASQLDTGGEEILIEAVNFTRKHLCKWVKNLEESYEVVSNTLEYPSQKSITRFNSKYFLKDLQCKIYPWVKSLTKLAKMEFQFVRQKHMEELNQISKWWKGLILTDEVKLARNQPLKWYTWGMASLEDPKLSEARIELTKAISFIYVLDDIFDIFGTHDQLIVFTQAVNRWEMDNVEGLPDYMQICLISLHDLTNEIGNNIYRKYGHNPANHLREAWATLCNAFLEEHKWFESSAQPKAEEYLEIARVSSGIHIAMIHIYFLLGLGGIGDNERSLGDIKDITSSIATILRLSDDLGSVKTGYDGSYIDYYVKEHEGISREVAQKHVLEMIYNEWKNLNKEQLRLSQYPVSFTRASLNLAR